jgi:uncharacterized protein (TIGR00251 family)
LSQSPYAPDGDALRLAVRVTPRARRSALNGIVDTGEGRVAVAVKLAAPPVDGAANEALVAFLAGTFGLPRASVRIVSGDKSRLKVVRLTGLSAEALAARLAAPR